MPQQTGHERHDEAGAATHRVRVNEIVTQIAFGGPRWVYTRIAGLSGTGPVTGYWTSAAGAIT